ncbi:hypothetical protein IFM89_027241 [Coptis chinensis]|uniref:TF-B3 domain-containing protein n=1 Tax=Coptis chinensis TaxID=261450 RepID=A0A835LXG3_9MAGN|nr:hypothetical protein IFM89_027241 [Coptis chinensis]
MASTTIQPRKPRFFKVIVPCSLKEISIPPAFKSRHLKENCSEGNVTLRTNRSSKCWAVSMKGFWFREGWEDFARAHDLCIGDFLVFKHEGGLKFHVRIFDPTACEKEYPLLDVVGSDDEKMEKVQTKEKNKKFTKNSPSSKVTRMAREVKEPPHFAVTLRAYNFKGSIMYIPAKFGRDNGLTNRAEVMTLKDPIGKAWKVYLRYKPSQGMCYIRNDWLHFADSNKLKLGDGCTFKLLSRGSKKVVMEVEVSKCKKGLKASRHPYFTIPMHSYHFKSYHLIIPRAFGRENGLTNKCCTITLTNSNKMSWEVNLKYMPSSSSAFIGSGWHQFYEANKLKVGDLCTFELVSRGSNKIVMNVSVS